MGFSLFLLHHHHRHTSQHAISFFSFCAFGFINEAMPGCKPFISTQSLQSNSISQDCQYAHAAQHEHEFTVQQQQQLQQQQQQKRTKNLLKRSDATLTISIQFVLPPRLPNRTSMEWICKQKKWRKTFSSYFAHNQLCVSLLLLLLFSSCLTHSLSVSVPLPVQFNVMWCPTMFTF